MAKLRFEIDGDPQRLALRTFVQASAKFLGLLHEIDQVMSGRYTGTVGWYMSSLHSDRGFAVDVVSRLKPPPKRQPDLIIRDLGTSVARSLVTGFNNVQNLGSSPPYLSDYGLMRIDSMLRVLERNGARGYKTTDLDDDRTVELSRNAIETVRALLPTSRKTIGSIEGKMESVSLHRRRRFIVYESLTKKAVACDFDDDLMPLIRESLGHRVLVSGMIHWNIKSEAKRVRVETIRRLGSGRLPTTRELSGAYPDIADGMTTEDYIRSLRGD